MTAQKCLDDRRIMAGDLRFSPDRSGERHARWFSWVALAVGALMCGVAALLS